jgi:Mor family transcriptional regulator
MVKQAILRIMDFMPEWSRQSSWPRKAIEERMEFTMPAIKKAVKKPASKKPAAKKTTAKKTSVKKSVAKKPAAKKTASKKR